MRLASGEVHVWSAEIAPRSDEAVLVECLTAEERERAARFRFDIHRGRYIAAHAALHRLLGSYLRVRPQDIDFETGAYGKPSLAASLLRKEEKLFFNMSHSADLAVFAFSRDGEIGVDTEFVDEQFEIQGVAETVFTARELGALYAEPAMRQHQHFFDLWARKEAYAKALGMGLSIPFKELQIGQAALINGIHITAFEPRKSFAGAVALAREPRTIEHFQFEF